jgi:Asp/Glu/hydantoin racemase
MAASVHGWLWDTAPAVRILVVLPTAQGVYPAEAEQRRIDRVRSYSTASTQVEVGFPTERSAFAPMSRGGEANALDLAHNHLRIADRMIAAEKDGYDACVPFGMIDFGVEIARSRCTIPIIGQTQAAYAMAVTMANHWGVISYRSGGHSMMRRQAHAYGFDPYVVGWGAAEMSNADMPSRRVELFERFVSEGKRLVSLGAEGIVCHGMSMAPIEYSADEYADAIGVPVLEGLGCGIAMAEAWVRIGARYSHIRHPHEQRSSVSG